MAAQWVTSSFRRLKNIRTTWLLVLLATVAAFLWQCSEDRPTSIVVPEPPIEFIDSVYPADGAIDVPLGSCVRITFLRQMDTATMTPNKFHFDIDNIYSLSIDTLKALMCAARGLDRATEYHVMIDSGIADTAGNVMTSPYRFSFRTESGDVFISAISPTNGQTDVPLDAAIEVTFNRGMNIATLVPSNIVVSDGTNGTLAYNDRRLVFTPHDSLEPYHEYTVTLKAAIADSAGATLGQDYSWTFTTVKVGNGYIQSVFPVDGATEVPIDATPYIQFSVAIDPASLTPGDFTVSGGVAGDVSIVGTYKSSVVFNPVVDLQSATSYFAAFHGDLASTTGQAIHIDRTWSFTTADTVPPQVVSVSPPGGAVDVPINTNVSMTFHRTINPASITAGEFYLSGYSSGSDQISVSGTTVTLNPYTNLPYVTPIAAVFHGDVSDNIGRTRHLDTTWTFLTLPDITYPEFDLSSRYPASGEGCIPVDAVVRIAFTRILDPSTINSGNFVFEEYNGNQLTGSLSCQDSIVEFRPSVSLTQLKEYQIKIFTGVKDIDGDHLPNPEVWRFTTRGENLWPLAIGNTWIYKVGGGVDSIAIVGDTTIAGKYFYLDQKKRLYRYENDTIETTFRLLNPNFDPYKLSNVNCGSNPPQTITTDSGMYLCQPLYRSLYDFYYYQQEYYFAPSIGMIRFYQVTYAPSHTGEPTRYEVWDLISYELR